jgi:5'-methylthioadenosine phosphorylase/purine-nucleoside phosphorylase
MPIHLRAEPGEYAANVLCPGDPNRATHIAETFFDPGYQLVNSERGMLGYTGTFEGQPISVQTTGMGCPSAGIVFEELAQLGARRFVRVGTCGGLLNGMQMGDIVIAMSATADDTTPLRYSGVDGFSPQTAESSSLRARHCLAQRSVTSRCLWSATPPTRTLSLPNRTLQILTRVASLQ